MSYTTQAAIEVLIPRKTLIEMLDDDGDGAPDDGILAEIITQASGDVDAYLSGRYATPFTITVPQMVVNASVYFACDRLYRRRGFADKNPFKDDVQKWRDLLQKVADGKISLGVPAAVANSGRWGGNERMM